MQTPTPQCSPSTPTPAAPCRRVIRPRHWPAATFIDLQLREVERFERVVRRIERAPLEMAA